MSPRPLLFIVPVALLLASCSKEEPAAPALPQVTKGSGVISGRVTLVGTPPPPKLTTVACDPRSGASRMTHTDKTVVVAEDGSGGLAGVYVYVTASSAHASLKGSGTSEPAKLLDQVDCYFVPHALAIQVGQPLRIRNSDPTFHNVHWDPKLNKGMNVGFGPAPTAAERIIALTHAEFLSVRCDVHPWMTSTVGVFDHPFFTTTDDTGQFTLGALPPGTYTVTTYHPFYGEGTPQQVIVPPATEGTPAPAARAEFVFQTK